MKLSEQLRDLGIRQEGDPVLRAVAVPFDLPAEAELVESLKGVLLDYVARVAELYPFRKGMGLAAPQVGVSRALAIVKPPDGEEVITIVNPVVLSRSSEEDDRYEGCLSFFDVRGMTRRPLHIDVQVQELDGSHRVIAFERGIARLVLHEIDHLAGRLYTDNLLAGSTLVPLDEYLDTRTGWEY